LRRRSERWLAEGKVAMIGEIEQKRVSQDPSWLIQRAWSVFRLPRLQELTAAAIAEVRHEAGEPIEHSGRSAAGPDPAAEALRVCCDEMRDASGVPGADAVRAQHVALVRRYMREESLDWSEAFERALGSYREAAAHAVERAFARASAA
jgi:hypothetical protein